MSWLTAAAIGFDVEIVDETEDVAALAVQGPTTWSILNNMGLKGLEELRIFGLTHFDFEGSELMVSRTGFTGDLGYELWIEPDKAEALWDALFEAGKDYAMRAIGVHALEQARVEAGLLAAYQDFLPANATVRTGHTRSPLELGLEWLVDFKKPNFNGRRALAEEKRNGSKWRLVKLDIEGNKVAHSSYIWKDKKMSGEKLGFTTSAVWSPICKQNIAIRLCERRSVSLAAMCGWKSTTSARCTGSARSRRRRCSTSRSGCRRGVARHPPNRTRRAWGIASTRY